MPLSLAQVSQKTRTFTVNYEGSSFTVSYYPNKFTINVINEVKEGNEDAVCNVFPSLIHSWDLYEDTEMTVLVPITPERLRDFPLDVLKSIIEEIGRDQNPEA